jgi:hypothetical protein
MGFTLVGRVGMVGRRVGFTAITLVVSLLISLLVAEAVVRVIYREKFAPRPPFYDQDAEPGWVPGANLATTFHGRDFAMRRACVVS